MSQRIADASAKACSASISTAKVSRYEHSLGQKLTSDWRQAESALNVLPELAPHSFRSLRE